MGLRISRQRHRRAVDFLLAVTLFFLIPSVALSEVAETTVETVGRGLSSSIALDATGSLHVAYLGQDAKVYYAFRPAGTKKWFSIAVIDATHSTQNIFPMVTVDASGQPHICVAAGELKYVTLRDGRWLTQVVDPGSGTLSYHCSIVVSADGVPHVSWYHEFLPGGKQFTHLRHADLENGVWVVRSVDGGISGKWNSMALDAKGMPRLSYSQLAYGGDLRYASWNGKEWEINDVDSSRNASTARGFDNSLALAADSSTHISYFDDTTLKYAHGTGGKWSIETVASVSTGYDHYVGSTTMLLDKRGNPHIIYGDFGGVRHAFRQGGKWRTELIVGGGIQQYPNLGAVLGPDDTLYVCYPDPEDGYVKVAVVKLDDFQESSGQGESPRE